MAEKRPPEVCSDETESAHSVSREAAMRPHADAGMSLYGSTGGRKYLNAAERVSLRRRTALILRRACLSCAGLERRTNLRSARAHAAIAIGIERPVENINTLKRRKR
jgi:hypothetical protein